MAAKWYIHQKEGKLGPMSALEVREALRSGTVDPMDLVSREGSAIKIELYEVDEIFHTGTASEASEDSIQPLTIEKPLRQAVGQQITGRDLKQTAESKPLGKSKSKKSSQSKDSAKRGRDPKKFFLYDRKKRKLGPLSAKEIQSIFYRGIVDTSAKVVKAGSDKRVPVATFVAVYAGSRSKHYEREKTQVGQPMTRTAVSVPSSRVLDEMAMMRRFGPAHSSLMSLWLPLLVIFILIGAGYYVIDRYYVSTQQNERVNTRKSDTTGKKSTQLRSPQSEGNRLRRDQRIRRDRRKNSTRTTTRKRGNTKSQARRAPNTTAPRRTSRTQVTSARRTPTTVSRRPIQRQVPRTTVRQRTAPRPTSRKIITTPRRSPPRPTSSSSIGALAGRIGSVGTASNVRFSKSALSACGMRCTLIFTDSAGKSMRVVFFKAAYESKLSSSGGRATITGRVSGTPGNLMMILQGVR